MEKDWGADKIRVFVSYPHAREDLRKTFIDVVFDEALRDIASIWTDDALDPGELWRPVLDEALRSSRLILLLLTPEFLASKFCTYEAARAVELAKAGRATAFAVLLEDCDYATLGLESLPLLSDDGKPFRSAARAREALARAQLDIKYAAYDAYERKHARFTEEPILGPHFELAAYHGLRERPMTTPLGTRVSLLAGALLGLGASLVWLRLTGVERWWWAVLMIFAISTVSAGVGGLGRSVELALCDRDWKWLRSDFALQQMIGGAMAAPIYAVAALLICLADGTTRAVALTILGTIAAAVNVNGIYSATRPKRLAVYADLVRANRRPPGGWRIETFRAELEQRREEFRRREYEELVEHHLAAARERERAEAERVARAAEPGPQVPKEVQAATARTFVEELRQEEKMLAALRRTDRLERRQRWKERPRNGRPLPMLAIFDAADEATWRALEATLREEGVDDLCEIRACAVETGADWAALLRGVSIVLPLLSARLCVSAEAHRMAAALRKCKCEVYPVGLEELDDDARAPFGDWQFLPRSGCVTDWAITEVAFQNVARSLIERLLHRHWEDGYPPLRRTSWDVDQQALVLAMWRIPIAGAASGLVIWTFARATPLWLSGALLAVVPLLVLLDMLWREQLAIRDFGRFGIPDGVARWRVISGVLPRFLAAAAVAAALYPALFAAGVAAGPPVRTFALMTFLDTAFIGGIAFGLLGYLASRWRRPNVLQKCEPPEPLSSWSRVDRRGVTVRAAYEHGRDKARGAIGDIDNAAPPAVDSGFYETRFSWLRIAGMAIETAVFTYVTWRVFGALAGGKPFPLKVAWAAFVALSVEALLLLTYDHFKIYLRERRHPPASLWSRLRYAWGQWRGPMPYRPLHIWLIAVAVLDGLGWLFSAPVAFPILGLIVAASAPAAFSAAMPQVELRSVEKAPAPAAGPA